MTANRSANATLKGYFYQFDHTIVQLLTATDDNASVIVEGIEDIDLIDGTASTLIQCKYYEGTKYNHSVIKDAVIAMFRHFHGNLSIVAQTQKYRIYGHYESGHGKLPNPIALTFLKSSFLTYVSDNIPHEVHSELSATDAQLQIFLGLLEINVQADDYETQQNRIEKLLIAKIPGCNADDVQAFYYPLAINAIQKLAICKTVFERTITKTLFFSIINKKDAVLSSWLSRKFGADYYARSIKRKYFFPNIIKIPKAARIFIFDFSIDFDLAGVTELLRKVGTRYSHVEHLRTPAADRFCPYIFVIGVTDAQLIELKQNLINSGIAIADGHAFNGSTFSPNQLVAPPTKDTLTKLKFVASTDQVNSVIAHVTNMPAVVFEFYKEEPLAFLAITPSVAHHKIMADSISLIKEAI